MAVKRVTKLPTISGIVQGGTATLDVPIGPRYHLIWIRAKAAAKTLVQIVSEMRIKLNGKVQRVHTATELDALNTMQGVGSIYASQNSGGAGNDYFIAIFLAEPWRKQAAVAEGMAWGTGDLGTFQIEIDLNASAGATITLEAYAEVDNSIVKDAQGKDAQAPIGLISKWFRTQIPITGTTQNIQTFPRRDNYQQISFFDANISNVQIKVDNFVIRDVTKAQNDATLVARGIVPVAGRFDMVFDHDDILDSALPMIVNARQVQDFQVNLTLSDGTARNIATIYQVIGRPE